MRRHIIRFKGTYRILLAIAFGLSMGFFPQAGFSQSNGMRLDIAPDPQLPPMEFVQVGIAVFELEIDGTGSVSNFTLISGEAPFIDRSRLVFKDWRFKDVPVGSRPVWVSAVFLYKPRTDLPDKAAVFDLPVPEGYADHHQAPVPSRIVEPGYPVDATGEGTVILQICLTAAGKVTTVDPIMPAGDLTAAAMDAARNWRFYVPSESGSPRISIAVVSFQMPKF